MLLFYIQGGSLLNFILLLTTLAIHECSHLVTITLFNYRVSQFWLTPFGGRLSLDPLFEINPEAEFFIAASGPLINWMMVGGVSYLQLLGVTNPILSSWQQYNFLIGLVNLIPASPLDGGRMLHAWFASHFGLKLAAKWSRWVSAGSSGVFIGYALMKLYRREGGSFYLLIGIFILWQLCSVQVPGLTLFWRLYQRKKKLLRLKGHLPVKTVAVNPKTPLRSVIGAYSLDEYLQFAVYDHGRILRMITEEEVWESLMKDGFKATFMETMNSSIHAWPDGQSVIGKRV